MDYKVGEFFIEMTLVPDSSSKRGPKHRLKAPGFTGKDGKPIVVLEYVFIFDDFRTCVSAETLGEFLQAIELGKAFLRSLLSPDVIRETDNWEATGKGQ